MARRPRRVVSLVVAALALAACSDAATTTPSTTASSAASPTTTTEGTTEATSTTSTPSVTTTSTTVASTTTTTAAEATTTTGEPAEIDAEIGIPEGTGPFPVVVLVHGGGWVGGNPSVLRPLATYLEDNGFMTVNTRYKLAGLDSPGFPEAVDDVACAVRYAAAHPASDGSVAVIGHSAGAHLGAVVALTGDEYATECPVAGSGIPQRFVGLAGPYDISRIGLAMGLFFGASPNVIPEAWEAGNPQLLTDANTDLDSLIMYGELDGLVDDSFAFDFHDALTTSGSESLLELVENARHNDVHDPAIVGDLIVTWLER